MPWLVVVQEAGVRLYQALCLEVVVQVEDQASIVWNGLLCDQAMSLRYWLVMVAIQAALLPYRKVETQLCALALRPMVGAL
jgi:hypothetical protein